MTSHRRVVPMLVLGLLACRVTPTPVEPRDTTTPTVAPPRPRGDAFLQLDADLAATYPLRARIVRAGAVRAEHDGSTTSEPSGRTMALEVTVLDADPQGDPMRPRVLCEGPSHRVAVHVDVDDLAIVARSGAVLTATPRPNDTWAETMPGVRLGAGVGLRVEGGLDRPQVRVVLQTPTVRAAGFVDRAHVGYTFVPDTLPEPRGVADARVREPAALLATPSGPELAKLDPHMATVPLAVRRLGPEQSGHVLVRHDGGSIVAVGWIAASAIEPAASASSGSINTIGRGRGELSEPTIELRRGTALVGGELRNAIGVVTRTARFHCVEDCDTPAPAVEVDACTTSLPVRAEPPRHQ